jgi:hypothetical protein
VALIPALKRRAIIGRSFGTKMMVDRSAKKSVISSKKMWVMTRREGRAHSNYDAAQKSEHRTRVLLSVAKEATGQMQKSKKTSPEGFWKIPIKPDRRWSVAVSKPKRLTVQELTLNPTESS